MKNQTEFTQTGPLVDEDLDRFQGKRQVIIEKLRQLNCTLSTCCGTLMSRVASQNLLGEIATHLAKPTTYCLYRDCYLVECTGDQAADGVAVTTIENLDKTVDALYATCHKLRHGVRYSILVTPVVIAELRKIYLDTIGR